MDDEELLLSDDLTPTDGGIFAPAVAPELTEETNEQRAMVQVSYPVFDDVLKWFDERIIWANSLAGINTESQQDVTAQVMAKQLLVQFLVEERGLLEALKATYAKN